MKPELIVCHERLSSVIKTENDTDCFSEEENNMYLIERTANEVDQDLAQKSTIKCEEEDFLDSPYLIKHEEVDIKSEDDVERSDTQVSAIGKKGYLQSNKRVAAHSAEPNKTVELYKCNNCCYETPCKPHLKNHMLLHSSYKTLLEKGLIIVRHKPKDEIKIHKCPDCPFQSKYKDSVKQHSVEHKKPDEVVWHCCTVCPYKTYREPYLKQHVLIHNREHPKWLKCTYCPFKALGKSILKRHLARHQDAERHLARYQDDERHLARHQDDDDSYWHKCPKCPIKTNCKYELLRHVKRHITHRK